MPILWKIVKAHKFEILLIITLLLISGLVHGINMFHFPYYENDEGAYMSQAWSLLKFGQLAPYTYWYDHAPAGWILIALWTKLTGGFFTFGNSINSGRVLMLVIHVIMTGLLYFVAKKLSKSILVGVVACLVFVLSPLGLYFQRRVLLDNIMIFWVFISLAILLKEKLKLSQIIFSAISFGVAVLSKENAIFFIPVFVYLLHLKAHTTHKRFAILQWLFIIGLIVSSYFLYAALKGELFPVGFLGDSSQHVSLLETLKLQFGRGSGLPFWDRKSDFMYNLNDWIHRDPVTITLGIISTGLGLVFCIRNRALRIPVLLSVLFFIFLMRGKTVINFYIVPVIPILAINIGFMVRFMIKKVSGNNRLANFSLGGLLCLGLALLIIPGLPRMFLNDETTSQVSANQWIRENLPGDTNLVIDNYAYIDLHDSPDKGGKVFPNADWFWKLEADPAIRNGKYLDDWSNVQYIALSHEMLRQMKQDNTINFLDTAFDHSTLVKSWTEGSTSYFDMVHFITTNGDWMMIYKVKSKETAVLDDSWKYYKSNFIHSYGQVVDPSNGNTTSEGQSYAMLRAVWENDRESFDGVWAWTKDHLQYRSGDKLLSWLWGKKDGVEQQLDANSASDADEDIALALLFASKQWSEPKYLSEAKQIVNDIWRKEVVQVGQKYYLISGSDTKVSNGYLINPSYISPASYKIFAEIDPVHPWNKLSDNSYELLSNLSQRKGNLSKLPPNWLVLSNAGSILPAPASIQDGDDYGFDAFRTIFRVGLDAKWNGDQRAINYLKILEPHFRPKNDIEQFYYSVYTKDNSPKNGEVALSTESAPIVLFTITNRDLAGQLYPKLYSTQFHDSFWGDGTNYYDQNWAWFGSAFYFDKLPNIWQEGDNH